MLTNSLANYKHVRLCLTNACPNSCSFCYRHRVKSELNSPHMSWETVVASIAFVYRELPLSPDFNIMPWGGEPLLMMGIIKGMVEEFPQIRLNTNTSGETVTFEDHKWLIESSGNLNLIWSMGNAYEKYGGIRQKLEALPWMALAAKEKGYSLNLTVTNPENLYEDYKYLRDIGYESVAVQQLLGVPYTPKQLKDYAEQLLRILEEFRPTARVNRLKNPMFHDRNMVEKSAMWFKEFGPQSMVNQDNLCQSGVEKLFIDTDGGVWQCDGSYLNREGLLGDVYKGIDWGKVQELVDEHKMYKPRNFDPCIFCDIREVCPNTLCLATNKSKTGDKYTPYPGFCDFQKTMVGVFQEYISNRKREQNG